jgi:hypothetical protein
VPQQKLVVLQPDRQPVKNSSTKSQISKRELASLIKMKTQLAKARKDLDRATEGWIAWRDDFNNRLAMGYALEGGSLEAATWCVRAQCLCSAPGPHCKSFHVPECFEPDLPLAANH